MDPEVKQMRQEERLRPIALDEGIKSVRPSEKASTGLILLIKITPGSLVHAYVWQDTVCVSLPAGWYCDTLTRFCVVA